MFFVFISDKPFILRNVLWNYYTHMAVIKSRKLYTLCHAHFPRGCQVIATNFFATFSSIFPIKPLFWNRGRYIVVTKSAGRM